MSVKPIFKAVFLITIFSVITRVLGFVFRIYLSRNLSPASLGVYQVATSVFGIFCCVVSSGLPLVISRKTAEYGVMGDKKAEYKTVTAGLIIGLVLSVICSLLIFIFKGLFVKFLKDSSVYFLLLLLCPAIIFSSVYSTFRGNLWGHKDFFGVCITELVEQVSRILICFIFFKTLLGKMAGEVAVTLSLTLACVVSGILALIIYLIKGRRLSNPKGYFKPVLASSTPITFMRIISSLVQPLISIIIPIRLMASGLTQTEAMAEIGVAMGMTFPLLFIPSALVGSLATALIPEISSAKQEGKSSAIALRIKSAVNFTLVISFLLIPIYIAIGPQIGQFLFNNAKSGYYLIFSSPLIIFICLGNITSSILNSLGKEAVSFKNYIVGAVLMLLSLWFLPRFIGVNALTVGMLFCLGISAVLNLKLISKTLGTSIGVLKSAFVLALCTVFLSVLNYFVYHLLIRFLSMFFAIAFTCIISAGAYALLLDMLGYVKFINIFIGMGRKVFKKRYKTPQKVNN